MIRELVSIFRGQQPLQGASQRFERMLALTQEMCLEASAVFWGRHQSPEERTALYEKDVEVNRLERQIRKRLVAHLSLRETTDVPYCLVLMSLIKDLERLGDYAKNLTEVAAIASGPFPEDELIDELQEIRRSVEALVREAAEVYSQNARDRAIELTIEGRGVSKRCDQFVERVARSDYKPPIVVALTLGARFYKRMAGHLLNLLSAVIMPLHKLDYFDEKSLAPAED